MTVDNKSAASSEMCVGWLVEKLVPGQTRHEEEGDPDTGCYLWERKAQRPKQSALELQVPGLSTCGIETRTAYSMMCSGGCAAAVQSREVALDGGRTTHRVSYGPAKSAFFSC